MPNEKIDDSMKNLMTQGTSEENETFILSYCLIGNPHESFAYPIALQCGMKLEKMRS